MIGLVMETNSYDIYTTQGKSSLLSSQLTSNNRQKERCLWKNLTNAWNPSVSTLVMQIRVSIEWDNAVIDTSYQS
jgi:hypothetical protein